MKLLIVDDHPGMRAMIRQIVAQPDDVVHECADGATAVSVAREITPDLIFMDVRLPGLGGIEATRVLHTTIPQSPVIVISAYDQPGVRHLARQTGASGFVAKDRLDEVRPLVAYFRARIDPASPNAERPARLIWGA
jgi:two-component system invasion response regulator UvrY